MTKTRSILVFTGAAGLLISASNAHAQTTTIACADTTKLPNPIYLAGSSAFEPILSSLALEIAKQGISIIYAPISSCQGVSGISPPAEAPAPQPLTGTAHYYTPDPTDSSRILYNTCNLTGGTMAKIGVSDVAFESCQNAAKPATVGEWFGPQQAMLIVVPSVNVNTTALSAEQAAVIWGCGAQGHFSPFIVGDSIQQRSSTSGTQIMVARNIGVPEVAFKGTANKSSVEMVASLLSVADPQTAIGFIAADVYATRRSVLNAVAFRGIKQTKAYYPDSDSTASDMLNVREGRYMIQGPLHLFSNLTAGVPTADVAKVIDWLTGVAPIDPKDPAYYVKTVASNGAVPQCAMKVRIDKDGGKFSPYTPPLTCNCAFQKAKGVRLATGTCTPCKNDTECTGGLRCQTGYCE